jgi:voltage-gated potassium channel
MAEQSSQYPLRRWRRALHTIIFESDTPAGKVFDIVLLASICTSVAVIMLESVLSVRQLYGPTLEALEWGFTLLFTLEYALRLLSLRRPLQYTTSFFGVVDLLSILPNYLSLLFPSTQYLIVVRILRLLRVFRILKLTEYLNEARVMGMALRASRRKITVFLLTVVTLIIILGSIMYVIEGEEHGFVNIPVSIYWAVVTMTTVGYGDLAPRTPLGQFFSIVVMLMGYGILAVPTGIVTLELARSAQAALISNQTCPSCGREGHDYDARHCKFCGAALEG